MLRWVMFFKYSYYQFDNALLIKDNKPENLVGVSNWGNTLYMLQTDCKLDQFVNGPPVYKQVIQFLNLVGPLSIIQGEVVPFRNRPNGLKAGRTAWKLAEWFTSSPNCMKAVQACRTNSPWLKRHESWPNGLQKHTNKVVAQAHDTPSNVSADQIVKAICVGVGWVLLAKLTSQANTNIKK